ncbi:MAG: putative glycoside hydrolase [Cellvibrio sp.]|uniref:putative glycoside hydrolase n=1 Tax=Cellvibrio sp. TaxID=1965322 RepID=UPI0031B424A1
MQNRLTTLSKLLFSAACISLFAPIICNAQTPNPTYFYLVKGELNGRGISVGDPSNWSTNIEGREGKSAGGKISVAPTSYKDKGDAIQLTWAARKKVVGSFGLYGEAIDLSKFKDAAALTIDMRIDVKPDKDVRVALGCGYPCLADLSINSMIKQMPKGEWFSLPLPLNCFKSDNFDLTKIIAPFSISTDGKFTVSIANIRLEKLGEGEKGCTAQPE